MKNIILKGLGIILVLLFGPLFFVLYLWLEAQSVPTNQSGLVISLGEDIDKKFINRWYYRFFSFLVHKKDEPFVKNLIRFLVFDLPLNIIIYGVLVGISVAWILTVFRVLFHIDIGPMFTTLLNLH